MEPAVALGGVGKRYRLTDDKHLLATRLLRLGRRHHKREMWALKDLSFECAVGETLGIIGRNGAGKTTLLRLLAGVSAPTVGSVRVRGRIAPLIGVGVGFDPELTGRENVWLNAQILGLTPGQVRERFDEIVEFSEIPDFIETPVKFYSSGMFLRLALSVAVHVEPEVMLVDEILAVGDVAFQAKSIERFRELQDKGTTIVMVTHNMQTLNRFCTRAVLLDRGTVVEDGPVDDVISRYYELSSADQATRQRARSFETAAGPRQEFVGGASVTAEVLDGSNRPTNNLTWGETFHVRVSATFEHETVDPLVGVMIISAKEGTVAFVTHTLPGEYRGEHGPGRPVSAVFELEGRLLAGSYRIEGLVTNDRGDQILGVSPSALVGVSSLARAKGVADLGGRVTVGDTAIELTGYDRLSDR